MVLILGEAGKSIYWILVSAQVMEKIWGEFARPFPFFIMTLGLNVGL